MKVNKTTMRTKTIKRAASVSRTQALKELFARYPNADLMSFTKKADKFEAILRMAGEPPFGGGDKKEPPVAEDAAEDSAEDSADDSAEDSADDSGGPPMDGGPDDGGDEDMEKKLSPEEETVHLLREILHAVQGGGMGGPPPGGPMDAMAEVGAPPQHGGMPGGHPGGPPPLPPPAKPMGGGPGAFASTKRSFVAELDGGNGLTYKQAVASAEANYTGYRVAKMERNEERDLIRVAMVKQA